VRFTIEQEFAAPLERVEAALVDPEYLELMSTLPKLGRPTLLERREEAGGAVVHQSVRYAFVGDLNAAVRRVVDPKRLTWVEEATIDRRTHVTTWRIAPDHYAHLLRAHGTFRLRPDTEGDGTRRTAEGELKVSVPFVGGKVEGAIVSGLREHAALEQGVLEDWLRDP
jgi:hypothetical protein